MNVRSLIVTVSFLRSAASLIAAQNLAVAIENTGYTKVVS